MPNVSEGLDGRAAVVTGASSGNGRAIALALAERGAAVVCADLNPDGALGNFDADSSIPTHELLGQRGSQGLYVRADVSIPADVEGAVELCVEKFGRLDILVNNAGVDLGGGDISHLDERIYDRTMAINAKGTWLGCKAAISQMRGQEVLGGSRGRIVNISSISGLSGQPHESAYAASKGAVISLSRALAIEAAPLQINVNVVAPGWVSTAMTRAVHNEIDLPTIVAQHPLGRIGVPGDVAASVAFLASDPAAWITGIVLPVDGGYTAA